MNKKQYRITLIIFGVVSLAAIGINYYLAEKGNWLIVFVIVSAFYIYIRYKISGPMQSFASKFNMLVDYDLDVEGALELSQNRCDNAPNDSSKFLYMIYLGMALYYNGKYREAMNNFNQITLVKVNKLYHVLIFAFTAYSAYEEGDLETFELNINRITDIKSRIGRKYYGFAVSYEEILTAMKNLDVNPEGYREVIEKNFLREDGYISTKLVYNYRMAYYYKTLNNELEMDKCLAKIIANGKNHHTAIQAKKMFKNTCNVEDFIFPEPGEEPQEVDIVDEPIQISELDDIEITNESEGEVNETDEKSKDK